MHQTNFMEEMSQPNSNLSDTSQNISPEEVLVSTFNELLTELGKAIQREKKRQDARTEKSRREWNEFWEGMKKTREKYDELYKVQSDKYEELIAEKKRHYEEICEITEDRGEKRRKIECLEEKLEAANNKIRELEKKLGEYENNTHDRWLLLYLTTEDDISLQLHNSANPTTISLTQLYIFVKTCYVYD